MWEYGIMLLNSVAKCLTESYSASPLDCHKYTAHFPPVFLASKHTD